MKGVLLLLLALGLAVVSADYNYTRTKVVRAYLENDEQVDQVNKWETDVWSRESTLSVGWNDFVVKDDQLLQLLKLEVAHEILIDSVEDHLKEGQRDLEESRSNGAALADFFLAYHTYNEITAFLNNLTSSFPFVKIFNAGKSIEGRDINGVVLTGTAGGTKKKIFVSGGQHAREWVAPATTLFIINQLATLYNAKDATVTALMNALEFHFVPLVNPDGYVYTWLGSSQRLWRKNRRVNAGGTYGVDLNRNWNDHWCTEGASKTPSSDTYCGTGPFSEPESTVVSNYVKANGRFAGGIDYHSYSQLILRPYGWTTAVPANEAAAKTIGDTWRARILAVNNVAYTSQASWQLYYTSGSAQDWYFSQAPMTYSYTIELRDTGTYGFQLPAAQIKPTGSENWAGFVYFSQQVQLSG